MASAPPSRWLSVAVLALALAGCAKAPTATAAARQAASSSALFSPFSRTPSAVKTLLKDITAQLTVRDGAHTVTVTDLSALPSVIWNVFNVDATIVESDPVLGLSTYTIAGTYDVLVKQLTVVDRSLVTFTQVAGDGSPMPSN